MDTQIFNKVEDPNDISGKRISEDSVPDFNAVNSNDDPVEREISDEEAAVKKNKRRKKTGKKDAPSAFISGLYDWVSAFLFALIAVVVIMTFCFRIVDVDGSSMVDTLHDRDKVIVTGLNYEPRVGDIVVISHGVDLDKAIVKRVIAVGGQTVDINSETGEVIVDGVVLDEPYINGTTVADNDVEFPLEIEDGKVFVLGDNRPISKDSRYAEVGQIDKEWIIGKVQFRFYPFDDIGRVE
ncbi:MAG: signal peptidase I [Clostridia bacterium]|nr:signal peptidase I [Clostridia bacterium]MBQ2153126.1 signal peptidase I [Clostridia bacterium]MBQ5439884.1 signal peptidase I [Clostridia bacterium]